MAPWLVVLALAALVALGYVVVTTRERCAATALRIAEARSSRALRPVAPGFAGDDEADEDPHPPEAA